MRLAKLYPKALLHLMKPTYRYKIARVTIGLIVIGGTVFGKGDPEVGNFRFADAAGLTGKISLMVDTSKLKPAGFAPGDTTGAIGIQPGSHRFTVASTEAGSASAMIPLRANTSTTVIAYCGLGIDPQTHQPKKVLQLLQRANPPPNGGRHFQLLYVSSQPGVDINLNGAPTQVKSMQEMNAAELPAGSISVSQAGKSIVNFTAPQAGNFLVVLYDTAAGPLAGLVLPDYK